MKLTELYNRYVPALTLWLAFLALCLAFKLPSFLVIGFFALTLVYTLSFDKIRDKKHFLPALVLVLAVVGVLGFMLLRTGAYLLYDQIVTCYEASSDYVFNRYLPYVYVSEFHELCMMLALFYLYAWLYPMSRILYDHVHYFAVFMLSLLPFFPVLLYNTPQPWIVSIPLLSVWLSLLLTSITSHKAGRPKTVLLYFVLPCMLISGCFFLVPESSFSMRSSSYQIRAYLLNKVDMLFYDLTHQSTEEGEVDLARAGDLFYTGAIRLEVENKAERNYYLKSYSGSVYKDNSWQQLPDEAYDNKYKKDYENAYRWYRDNVFDALSENTQWEVNRTLEDLTIKDMRGSKEYALMPYFMNNSNSSYTPVYDSYLQTDDTTTKFQVWDTSTVLKAEGNEWEIKSIYPSFAYDYYTQVPVSFVKVMESQNEEFLDNLKNTQSTASAVYRIRQYLSDKTDYTLTPGRTPNGEDFVDYFLNENKRGYCVHYATTATLMLRYLGIPARYAEGYIVNASDYQDGKAAIPDRNAHAWVEIFDATKGWIPYEVTPLYNGYQENTKYDEDPKNIQESQEQKREEEQKRAEEIKKQNNTEVEDTPKVDDTSDTDGLSTKTLQTMLRVAILLLILLLIFVQRRIRLYLRKKRCLDPDTRKGVMASIAYMEELNVDWDNMPQVVSDITDKALYSQHEISQKEQQIMYAYALKQAELIEKELKLKGKIIYRYIKAYH